MKWKVAGTFLICSVCFGCIGRLEDSTPREVEGYRPLYGTLDDLKVGYKSPRAIQNPGKIYLYKNYLLVNEIREGVHVFDNTDPAAPVNVGFISLLGNTDFAIRNDVVYADALGNLVALDASDLSKIKEQSRLPLQEWYLGVPAPAGFYFECIEPEKGKVISWTKAQLKNPSCYAIN